MPMLRRRRRPWGVTATYGKARAAAPVTHSGLVGDLNSCLRGSHCPRPFSLHPLETILVTQGIHRQRLSLGQVRRADEYAISAAEESPRCCCSW